jgi:hypothetical protein
LWASARRGSSSSALSSERAATLYSLIGTAKSNSLDPEPYLRDVSSRIADHPINRIKELMPWNVATPDHRVDPNPKPEFVSAYSN